MSLGGAGNALVGVGVSFARRHRCWGREVIEMKAGQSPSMHDRSRLQLSWSMVVLRPKNVSIGRTDKQLETRAQSPQPSQMR